MGWTSKVHPTFDSSPLHPDNQFQTSDGTTGTLEKIASETRLQAMYNLTVATAHTYFVGEGEWLVHNACFGYTDDFNYRRTFFEAYPELEGKVVVHHAVEQQTLRRYPSVVTPNEIHSLENLRGIPLSVNSEIHLSRIRMIWNQFYRANPNPTQVDLLIQASIIDQLFGSVFRP